MGKLIGIIIAVIIVIGGYWLWSNNANAPADVSPSPTATPGAIMESPSPSAMMESEIKSFTVVGSPFTFDVKEIRVKKGDTVNLTFTNAMGSHDWRLDEFNAKTNILAAGQSQTIQFIADKTGTFEYYCSVSNHRQMGMVGKLIVE